MRNLFLTLSVSLFSLGAQANLELAANPWDTIICQETMQAMMGKTFKLTPVVDGWDQPMYSQLKIVDYEFARGKNQITVSGLFHSKVDPEGFPFTETVGAIDSEDYFCEITLENSWIKIVHQGRLNGRYYAKSSFGFDLKVEIED